MMRAKHYEYWLTILPSYSSRYCVYLVA